jgi:octaprenyl-diphosphate synthase
MSATLLPNAEETRRRLSSLYAPISEDLAATDRVFAAELASRHPHVQKLVEHALLLRGKKLRPALLLLCGRACGGVTPDHHTLAAVVEMIHTATLVHDDILDESRIRRHASTINAAWGNETAVLLGDYLFSHAYHLAATLETTQACRWIGLATNLVCEGEMLQVSHRGNLELTESEYFEIIRGKTAELTAIACRLGAHYAGAPTEVSEALDTYGRDLGVAFQIADDLLDLLGEEDATGKTLGTDLEKQKLTLPVIRLLNAAPAPVAARVRRCLAGGDAESRRNLRPALEEHGAIAYAWAAAERFAASAAAQLAVLPDSDARDVLAQLARYVIRRPF